MFVSKEALAVHKGFYELVHGTSHPDLDICTPGPKFSIWLNYEIDLVHLNPFCTWYFDYIKTKASQVERDAFHDDIERPAAFHAVHWHHSDYFQHMRKVKNVALDLQSGFGQVDVQNTWAPHVLNDPEAALPLVCPNLENILIIQDDDIGTEVENLRISTSGTLKEVSCMNAVAFELNAEFNRHRTGVQGAIWWPHKVRLEIVKQSTVDETEKPEEEGTETDNLPDEQVAELVASEEADIEDTNFWADDEDEGDEKLRR